MLKSEQLYRDLENESALFDGENTTSQKVSEESLSHMQNWSLIGAALRNELPSKVNMSLADNVMAQIKNENIKPEPAKIKEISLPSFKIAFKKFSFGIAQVALAASVAAITIIGWQTYNADEGITGDKTTAPLGSVEGVNLASYQTAHNDKTLKFNDKSNQTQNLNEDEDKVNSAELKNNKVLKLSVLTITLEVMFSILPQIKKFL